jgi:predicted Zn-ribbon and HTH transcriptional regulator
MAKKTVKMLECACERCGHSWTSRIKEPILCPKCKSAYWDIPKKEKKE